MRWSKKVVRRAKKTWYGKRYFSKAGVARLAKDVAKIKGALNTEQKYVDINVPFTTLPASGSWSLTRLNGLN